MSKFEAPDYLRLVAGGSRYRLMRLKDRTTAHNQNRPPSTQYASWRDARSWGFHNWASAYAAFSAGQQNGVPVWVTHCGEYFRDERFADECEGGPGHRGWYTNADCATYRDGSGKARGIVARLPHGRFIAGYWWGDNGERVYFPEVFTDESDAARMADSHAESWADICREDSERYDAMCEAENKVEEKLYKLQESFALRHKSRFGGFDRVRDSIEELREARKELAEATRVYEGG